MTCTTTAPELATPVLAWADMGQPADATADEALTWTAAAQLPDADITVLMWVRYSDGTSDWAGGWWDGDCWRDAASGGVVAGTVTHWAEPVGPAA